MRRLHGRGMNKWLETAQPYVRPHAAENRGIQSWPFRGRFDRRFGRRFGFLENPKTARNLVQGLTSPEREVVSGSCKIRFDGAGKRGNQPTRVETETKTETKTAQKPKRLPRRFGKTAVSAFRNGFQNESRNGPETVHSEFP